MSKQKTGTPKNPKEISRIIVDDIFFNKDKRTNYQEKIKKYGSNYKKIQEGKNARLAGLASLGSLYDIEGITKELDLISYNYGYITLASRVVAGGAIGGLYTREELNMLGQNDANDDKILFEELPKALKECKEYLEGYKQGSEEIQKKNKHIKKK